MAWAPIKVSRKLVIEGGFLAKAYHLDEKEVETPHGVRSFVKVDKRQEWLVKAAAGKGARPGALTMTKLLEAMREILKEMAGEGNSEPAPEDAAGPAVAEDPMEALAALQEKVEAPKKRKGYVSKRRQNQITEIEMRELEPTKHPNSERKRKVKLLAVSTNSLWLSIGDLDWLVTWLADELETGGVPMEDAVAVPDEALECNCQAPGVHIR